jgi:hypothetical protein
MLVRGEPASEIVSLVAAHGPRGARSGASIARLAKKLKLPAPRNLARAKKSGTEPSGERARLRWTDAMTAALAALNEDPNAPTAGPEFVAEFAARTGVGVSGMAIRMKAGRAKLACVLKVKKLQGTPAPATVGPPTRSAEVATANAIAEGVKAYDALVSGRPQMSLDEEMEALSQPMF